MLARRLVQPARAFGLGLVRRQMSVEAFLGPAAKVLEPGASGLSPAQAEQRYSAKLEELNKWVLAEEADYLASKGESKSLDDVAPGPAPIKMYGVSGRYATGLYNAAVKAKELAKVDADLKKIAAAAQSSATILNFIESPTLARGDRLKGTEELTSALGCCDTTKKFLSVLATSGRTKFLMPIATNFHKLTAAASGELTVTLTAARVLPDMEEKAIVDEIKKEFMPWERVKIVRKYDPEIMDGYVVDFGDKILDKSYGSKLKKIKNALTSMQM